MVLRHIIESGVVPVVRLTEVFRQAARSRIIINALRINEGQTVYVRSMVTNTPAAALV